MAPPANRWTAGQTGWTTTGLRTGSRRLVPRFLCLDKGGARPVRTGRPVLVEPAPRVAEHLECHRRHARADPDVLRRHDLDRRPADDGSRLPQHAVLEAERPRAADHHGELRRDGDHRRHLLHRPRPADVLPRHLVPPENDLPGPRGDQHLLVPLPGAEEPGRVGRAAQPPVQGQAVRRRIAHLLAADHHLRPLHRL